jgi:hypothetical protein
MSANEADVANVREYVVQRRSEAGRCIREAMVGTSIGDTCHFSWISDLMY